MTNKNTGDEMTKPIELMTPNQMVRINAWMTAKDLVDPIVEQHGIEKYVPGSTIFGSGSTVTPVQQHINHIFEVAEWLLEKGEE